MLTQINYEKLPSFYLGLERWIEKGKLEGEKQKAIEIAKVLLYLGDDIAKISKATSLSESEIKNIIL